MIATDLGRVNEKTAKGNQRLYRLDPPLKDWNWSGGTPHELVVVSAVDVFGEPETYIFPSDGKGNVTDWGELPGSQKGTLSHTDVLEDLGYEVVQP